MKRIFCPIAFCFLIFVQIAYGQTQSNKNVSKTQNKTKESKADYPNLKMQAKEASDATATGDFAKIVDFTHPKIVQMFGGKDKMITFLRDDSAQMKADGFELESVTVGEAKQIEKIDSELFAIVPITMKIKSPNGKAIGESSIVGISTDNGTNWKFINGVNQDRFKKVFPKAAEKIHIPDELPPQQIENE